MVSLIKVFAYRVVLRDCFQQGSRNQSALLFTHSWWGRDRFLFSQGCLNVSRYNGLDWNSNSAFPFFNLSYYPLLHHAFTYYYYYINNKIILCSMTWMWVNMTLHNILLLAVLTAFSNLTIDPIHSFEFYL